MSALIWMHIFLFLKLKRKNKSTQIDQSINAICIFYLVLKWMDVDVSPLDLVSVSSVIQLLLLHRNYSFGWAVVNQPWYIATVISDYAWTFQACCVAGWTTCWQAACILWASTCWTSPSMPSFPPWWWTCSPWWLGDWLTTRELTYGTVLPRPRCSPRSSSLPTLSTRKA